MRSSSRCNSNSIDASVGALVWVQRRNGSWWPGRILGKDELTDNSHISPKSDTPVQLLGRKNLSVDWYNLERSNRVKPFRCGEYDTCIEKVKSNGANDSKKSLKYARREYAIAQALDLERSRVLIHDTDTHLRPAFPFLYEDGLIINDSCERNIDVNGEINTLEEKVIEGQELSQSGLSFEEPNCVDDSMMQNGLLNDSDNDWPEGTQRLRDLEDFGMGTTRNMQTAQIIDNTTSCSNKSDFSLMKFKRSQGENFYSFLKKKIRCRSMIQVLETAQMVSVPTLSEELGSPCGYPVEGISDSLKSNGGPIHAPAYELPSISLPETDRVDLFDVPFMAGEKLDSFAGFMNSPNSFTKPRTAWRYRQSSRVRNVGCTNSTSITHCSTSNWRSTRKRKARRSISNKKRMNFTFRKERVSHHPIHRSSNCHLRKTRPGSVLYDVNLEVKADYKPQHVPLISLMSKLNGNAIVGHPLPVEALNEARSLGGFREKDMGTNVGLTPRVRRCVSAAKKMKKLSSLTAREEKMPSGDGHGVPLHVVFGRIREGLSL